MGGFLRFMTFGVFTNSGQLQFYPRKQRELSHEQILHHVAEPDAYYNDGCL